MSENGEKKEGQEEPKEDKRSGSIVKSVTLNLSERLFSLQILNGFKGSMEALAIILEDIKQFTIKDDEWKKANRKIDKRPDGTENWNWEDKDGPQKEITLQQQTLDYLRNEIKDKNEKGEFTLQDKSVVSLNKKLA